MNRNFPAIFTSQSNSGTMEIKSGRLLATLLAISACIIQTVWSQAIGLSVESYDIHVAIQARSSRADITAACGCLRSDTASRVVMLLNSSCSIDHAECSWDDISERMQFQFVGKDSLEFSIPSRIKKRQTFTLKFAYSYPIDTLGDNLFILDRGHRWYPLIIDQIARVNLGVDVPEGYEALSTGNLVSMHAVNGRSRYDWQSTMPVFKIPLIVFKKTLFRRTTATDSGKSLVLYSSTLDSMAASRILVETRNAFRYYGEHLGGYPYDCLTLVEVPYFEGIDVTSGLLMVGSASFDQMKHESFEALHLTIAQQWIGAGVFAKFGQPGFWFLAISLPHYLRLMYVRETQGDTAFRMSQQEALKRYGAFAGGEKDIPIMDVDAPNSKEKGLILYAKGPFVLGKIHQQLGDRQWIRFVRELCSEYRGKILTVDGFRECLSRFDEHGRILTLLNKLLREKGLPDE